MIRNMCESLEAFFNEKIKHIPTSSADGEKDTPRSEKTKNATPISKKRSKDGGSHVKTPAKKKKLSSTSVTHSSSNNKSISKAEATKTPEKKNANSEHTPSRRDSRKHSTTNGSKSTTLSSNRHLSFNFFAHTSNIPQTSTSAALKYCHSMVRELFTKKHADYAWPFYDPVDPQSLQLTDYDNIIHYPMDLNSVSKNLDTGKYLTAFECITDLRRMVTNSCRYNPPEHIVSQAGQRLIVAIELLIAKAPPEVYDFLVVAPCSIIIPKIDALPEATSGVVSMCKQQSRVVTTTSATTTTNNKLSSTTKTKATKSNSYVSDEDYDDDYVNPLTSKTQHGAGFVSVEMNHAEPMTYEEKRKLSLEINRMPTEKLGDIISFLSELESDIFKEKNQSEVEIDFDNMKPETLRALEKYVKYLNKPQKPRKKKPTTISSSTQSADVKNNSTATKAAPSITNISNPLTSTLKKSKHCSFEVVSSLALSEESDDDGDEYSNGDSRQKLDNTSRKSSTTHLSSIPNAHSNISVSKSSSNNLASGAGVLAKSKTSFATTTNITSSKNIAANKLTFDTIDESFLPSSMLDKQKKSDVSSTDLINEAKATVKQQKLASLNSSTTSNITPPVTNEGDNSKSQQLTPKIVTPNVNSSVESPVVVDGTQIKKHHAVSVLTSSNSAVNVGPIIKPEIRSDTNAPRAPTSLEERERMKQEERQRRLAVASTSSHSNKLNNDIISSYEDKL